MKKILIWILLTVIVFSLFGCGGKEPSNSGGPKTSPKPVETASPAPTEQLPSPVQTPEPVDAMTEYRKTIESQKVYLLSYKEFPVDDIYVLGDEKVKEKFDTASIAVFMITPSEYDKRHSVYTCDIAGGLEHTEYADPHGTYWIDSYNYKGEDYEIAYNLTVLKAYGRIDMDTLDFRLYDNMYSRAIHNEYISMPVIRDEKTLDDVGDKLVKIGGNHYLVKQKSGVAYGIDDVEEGFMFIPLDCKFEKLDLARFGFEKDESNESPRHITISYIPDHMCQPEGSTGIAVTRYFDFEGDSESEERDAQWDLFWNAVDFLVVETDGEPLKIELTHR